MNLFEPICAGLCTLLINYRLNHSVAQGVLLSGLNHGADNWVAEDFSIKFVFESESNTYR